MAPYGQKRGPEEALGDDGSKGGRTTTRTMKEKETMSVGRGRITPPPPPHFYPVERAPILLGKRTLTQPYRIQPLILMNPSPFPPRGMN